LSDVTIKMVRGVEFHLCGWYVVLVVEQARSGWRSRSSTTCLCFLTAPDLTMWCDVCGRTSNPNYMRTSSQGVSEQSPFPRYSQQLRIVRSGHKFKSTLRTIYSTGYSGYLYAAFFYKTTLVVWLLSCVYVYNSQKSFDRLVTFHKLWTVITAKKR
jgi:hypothetical protein